MKRAFKILGIVLLGLIAAIGVLVGYSSYSESNEHGLNALIRVIKSSNQFIVSEGLPHPRWERQLFQEEMRKPNSSYRDHHFYEGKIEFSEEARREIEEMFINREFSPSSWYVMKFCGGFHPDFRVVWSNASGSEAEALFCFQCNEVHLYSGIFRCKFDIPQEVEDRLEELWWPYRLQRPEPNRGEQVGDGNPDPVSS